MCNEKYIIFAFVIVGCFTGLEAVINFEDENFFGHTADTYNWLKHPCRRICKNNEKPRECHYVFVVEKYSTMSKACYDCPFNVTDCFRPHCNPADGVQKSIYTANRQLPGPLIEVCQNDIINVEVRNAMIAESTSIHWHGIKQKGTPYMDGTAFVTQCPILPGNKFRYVFKASTSGSYFWHSHLGSQRDDGLFGPLIIHSAPKENPHKHLYDYDHHIILLNDWTHLESSASFLKDYHAGSPSRADTILVNGLGRYKKLDRENFTSEFVPTATFNVKKGIKYRFRLISAGATDCPIEMSIDNHTMLIIAMDGMDIEPVEVDDLFIWNGERYDIVIEANQEIENYWIRFRGHGTCNPRDPNLRVYQVAILHYKNAPFTDPKSPIGYDIPKLSCDARILNPYNNGTEDKKGVSLPNLNALAEDDLSNTKKPDYQFYITYDYYPLDNYDFHRRNLYGFNEVPDKFKIMSLQLNHIGLKLPSFSLLSQSDMIRDDTFCNSTTVAHKNCTSNFCACTQVLQVKLNSIVELVIIDEGQGLKSLGDFNHPLHLHGHSFRVIAMERLNQRISVELVKKLDQQGKIKRKLKNAPLKDTVKVPTNGYTIIRFHVDNPGYWLYHCHVDQHTDIGMALIFKVGEYSDLPPVPKNFPTCGNFYRRK